MVVAIAIERFYAVHYPHNYKSKDRKRVVLCVSCVSMLAFLLTVSKFFEFRPQGNVVLNETNYGCNVRALFTPSVKDSVMPTEMYRSPGYLFYDAILFNLLIVGIVPFVTLIYLYSKIYRRIREISSNVDATRSDERRLKREADLAGVFAGFVITFLVSR